ncbi:MAG: hypothetical protein GXP54_05090, partial [Deltaproteobacteria bacterium]|nr:hypothetical protein [Deltaproteobacteria bacterium]
MADKWMFSLVLLLACGGGGTTTDGGGFDAVTLDMDVPDQSTWDDGFSADAETTNVPVYRDEPFLQDRARWFTTGDGLPSDTVNAVFIEDDGSILAATDGGAARGVDGVFKALPCAGSEAPVTDIVSNGSTVAFLSGDSIWIRAADGACTKIALPSNPAGLTVAETEPFTVLVAGATGIYEWSAGSISTIPGTEGKDARDAEVIPDGRIAIATGSCLVIASKSEEAVAMCKAQGLPSDDVRSVAWDDSQGLLWIGTSLGLASWKPGDKNAEPMVGEVGGLPYDDITSVATGASGMVAAGTPLGALRREPARWHLIHGRNLIPDNGVLDLAVEADDTLWIATAQGLARITRVPTTLEDKAAFFDEATHARHDRMGMVSPCSLTQPGVLSTFQTHDDDNDGQWTEMYLAAQSFRCAVTKDADGCAWARASMEAMLKLESVTEIPGFFARSIVPGDECAAKQGGKAEWHLTSDEQWCWKGDPSTDEFVGHIF